MELYQGSLDVNEISNRWFDEVQSLNFGAFITFTGIIRAEDSIEA
ncbi:MAG TPA: molybdenum cofactor biosynthesis protein MoaE, partial [Nitratifractor sp.]|nr:molybdenum cofactor biosynthesis protein MoaE [Nitratifractor sp.]